ncbi:MAG: DUF5685 family protein [Lachnospiraceae bacterium]|nr:DUF5685 family protein [Lachnospiraceae bacterium]
MFGYITINKSELKFREFDVYHSYYCGLCKCLKKQSGVLGQMTLSFDMTFAALLLSSLYEPENEIRHCRCLAHPIGKHLMCRNSIMDYLADMNILLTIHKCEDDWKDERKLHRKLYGDLLEEQSEKIKIKYHAKDEAICSKLRRMAELEAEKSNDIDKMAGLFGEIMGEVLAYREDEWTDNLRAVGYHLGKFIYILDAYDDLIKDEKKKNYNPLIVRKNEKDFEDEVQAILTVIMSDCCREFELLPIVENVEILRNILYSGVWSRYEEIKAERNKGKK